MRLLESAEGCDFNVRKNWSEGNVPKYAILSHTWGLDEEEVTFDDLGHGTGVDKNGYRKLKLCADLARHDELTHFWVDTCCIDKRNSVELNTAITSMYRWYWQATKCYVYLSDVPREQSGVDHQDSEEQLVSDFSRCRWLTRGWTLQELLAPDVVEFYDKTGRKIGD